MHECKLKIGVSPIIEITKENFEQRTAKREPYYSIPGDENSQQYAVCPKCDNPVQIIGLYKKLKNTDRPFGKHLAHAIVKLAEYDHEEYLFCPYANPNKRNGHAKRSETNKMAKAILSLLHDQFDRVIEILSKSIDICISEGLAESMLKNYLQAEGYLYSGATLMNLPWFFGYVVNAQSLFGRNIVEGSELQLAIEEKCSSVMLVPSKPKYVKIGKKENQFVNLHFCLIHHTQTIHEDDLRETIVFWVHQGNGTPPETVYKKIIEVDSSYFSNILSYTHEKSKLDMRLLEIADKLIQIPK